MARGTEYCGNWYGILHVRSRNTPYFITETHTHEFHEEKGEIASLDPSVCITDAVQYTDCCHSVQYVLIETANAQPFCGTWYRVFQGSLLRDESFLQYKNCSSRLDCKQHAIIQLVSGF